MKNIIFTVFITLTFVFIPSAYAEKNAPSDMPTINLAKMDTNGDQQVSKDEYLSYHAKVFANMDKDANGILSAEEQLGKGKGKSEKEKGKKGKKKKGKN